jgi:hypothetical protein
MFETNDYDDMIAANILEHRASELEKMLKESEK